MGATQVLWMAAGWSQAGAAHGQAGLVLHFGRADDVTVTTLREAA